MTREESWVAEQVRLIALEDGFGPEYTPQPKQPAPDSDGERAA